MGTDPVPNLRVFQAAVKRELLPIERAAVADGIDGRRRHTVYLRWNVAGRNDRWEADHVELPILVLPNYWARTWNPDTRTPKPAEVLQKVGELVNSKGISVPDLALD